MHVSTCHPTPSTAGEALGYLTALSQAGLSSRRGKLRFTSAAHGAPTPPSGVAKAFFSVAAGGKYAFVGVAASGSVGEKACKLRLARDGLSAATGWTRT